MLTVFAKVSKSKYNTPYTEFRRNGNLNARESLKATKCIQLGIMASLRHHNHN